MCARDRAGRTAETGEKFMPCPFCPSMKKKEIQALWENYPDLFERAIALEHGSAERNVNVKGLGRDWSWESYYNEFMANKEFEEAQLTFDQLFPDSPGAQLEKHWCEYVGKKMVFLMEGAE